jgi:hypothetical protein
VQVATLVVASGPEPVPAAQPMGIALPPAQ